jgi:hypothetical protein
MPTRYVLLIGVFLLALFFNFYNLAGVPAEMESDHAENVLDVNDVMNGARPIFFERNAGREPLAFYATASLVAVTQRPLDFMALKLVSAAAGLLLVAVVFLLTRELFEFDVALTAAALVAIGKWPVSLARLGLGFVFVPLAVALTVYFLIRALKTGQRNDFLATGFCLGLGLYGSDAFRFSPLLVLTFLVLWYFLERRRVRLFPYLRHILLMFVLALIVALPLVRYAIEQPTAYWFHTLTRLGAGGQPSAGIPVITFAGNLFKAVLMFNWAGDGSWLVNVPGDPALDPIIGSLFLLGLAFALYRLLRLREKAYLFVLVGLLMTLVPSALSLADPAENPSSILASGAIPFAFILAAVPVVWAARVIDQSMRITGRGRAAAVGFVVLVIAFAFRANYLRYFVDFDSVYRQASWNSSEIAGAIRGFDRSIGDAEHAWLIAYAYWVDARNVGINMGQPGWQQTLPNADAAQSVPPDAANKLYILHSADRDNLAHLQQLFPQGQPRLFHARTPGHDFVLFYVPGTGAQSELFSSQYFDQGN